MKILITGSSGFIGKNLLENLNDNYELILPLRNTQKITSKFKNLKTIPFKENISNIIKNENPDIVINLIGILTEKPSLNITFEKVHVDLIRDIIEGCKATKVQKIIHISALGADIHSKSRYARTKAIAENIIINSAIDYIILRPSIVLGKEQKLFKDLKKLSRFSPFLLAPKGKVQPVHVLDVVETIIKGIENSDLKNQIIELCGNRIISYRELFEFALAYVGVKRPVIEVPLPVLKLLVPFMEILPEPPITRDQTYLLEKDNICTGKFITQKEILGQIRNPFKIK